MKNHLKRCGIPIEKQETTFCKLCDRRLVNERTLKNHMQSVHKIGSPYECDTCGKTFFRKENYQDHLSHHIGEFKYECEWCRRRFCFSTNYYSHRRQKHPEEYAKYAEQRDLERALRLDSEEKLVDSILNKTKTKM